MADRLLTLCAYLIRYSARIAKQLETSPSSNLKEVKRIFGVPLAILVGQNQLPEFLPTSSFDFSFSLIDR